MHLQTYPDYDDISDDGDDDDDNAVAEDGGSDTSTWMTADSDFFSEQYVLLKDVKSPLFSVVGRLVLWRS